MINTPSTSGRNFLNTSAINGAAFSLGLYKPAAALEAKRIKAEVAGQVGLEKNAWIQIAPTGKVMHFSQRAELGQGIYQSIPQIIAEEPGVDMKDGDIVFAKGNQEKYGSQLTGGSSTIRGSYENLLLLGATARELLIMALGSTAFH